MEAEKLFLDIEGPRLQALRYIYAPDKIDNGFRVGLAMNKHAASSMTIEYRDKYYIKFYRTCKPKFNKITKMFDPPIQILLVEKSFDTLQELKNYLYIIIEEKYNGSRNN